MGNIILVTHWLDGDVIPFVRIGKELRRRGHQVTLITHCHFKKMAEEAGLNFEPWDTPEEYQELVNSMNGEVVQKEIQLSDEGKKRQEKFKEKHESFDVRMKEYDKVMKYCKHKETVILCKNRSSIAAYMVAEKLKLPLALVMMNPTEILSSIAYNRLYANKDLPLYNRLRTEVGLVPIKSWLQWESSAKMTLALWPDWYEKTERNWPSSIEKVGFPIEVGKEYVKKEVPLEVVKWLESKDRPILITGGTTKLINPLFYPYSIAACEALHKPTIVLTQYPELLPQKLPDYIKWYRYLPLDNIMPYLGAIIHHGGMGTLAGALKAGIPQLILPCFVDRPYNAALIKELGVGSYLGVSKWHREEIKEALEEVLRGEMLERCKEYAEKMLHNKGISTVADRIEKMIGSTYYQYELRQEDGIYTDKNQREQVEIVKGLSLKKRDLLFKRLIYKEEN